jgi:DNA (cytosine-5)-methyltransferase 3A
MNILSLFDGISCAKVALDRAGISVGTYYASEIDKNAIAISTKNHPGIVRLGDVRNVTGLTGVDLLIGGSPCQDLSIAKKERKGLDGDRSGLFWEYVRILREVKPAWFLLENVASMPKKDRDIITAELGIEPVMFDASLVSAQSRKRLFWTNIKFDLPADRGIVLKDILQEDAEVGESMVKRAVTMLSKPKEHAFVQIGYVGEKNACGVGGQALRVYSADGKTTTSGVGLYKIGHIGNTDSQGNRVYSSDGKSCTLSANGGGLGAKTGLYEIEHTIRKLTPVECERLQGLPDGYTEGVAKTHRYKCLGNAFNVDVIAHILNHHPNSHTRPQSSP